MEQVMLRLLKCTGGDLIINNENVYSKDEVDAILEDYIEEAPIDGKQYARKDADWIEVEATSGGGGSTPTPEDLVWEDKTADRALGTEYD